ncbi:MAG: phosphoenolpyruvate--protein phosphotransferase [Rhodospirillaceae bacterium TMED8]|nr:phosphoenolpyruvate--protein phosphotransferase [Magnetovibrio sp.]OUT53228.1 MAG: phosphoenolpyruvate--protein phosphotransferase [Rhodospirillaceae bacterium TMED8]
MSAVTPASPGDCFQGLGVSSGIAVGPAHVREASGIEIPEYSIAKSKIATERNRLGRAVQLAQRQIRKLQNRANTLEGLAAEEIGYLLEAYAHMLKDSRLVRDAETRITDERVNAEAAVQHELARIASTFEAMDDTYIAARLEDIKEVGNRIIRNLTLKSIRPFSAAPKGSVIIADQLTPADIAQIDPNRIAGVATTLGGAEGHTAIMARALGLPAVLGAENLLSAVSGGDVVIVDGKAGQVVVLPDKSTLDRYRRRRDNLTRRNRQLNRLRRLPAESRDGTTFSLQANVELPIEMPMVEQAGSEGVGLLRSEFMFMNRETPPDEDEQLSILLKFVAGMNGRPVTFRSLDVGAEKRGQSTIGELNDSAASALGLRGIRLAHLNEDLLLTQFVTALRAANHGPIRILLPMVSTVSEVQKARQTLKFAVAELRRRKLKIPNPMPPLGVMIEVPGAALSADALAQVSDFFAIGSNDLTMYTLAADRANEHVAHLYNPLHPAVLRLIQFTTTAALRARIPVSICGEIAGDPRFTALLAGLGLREFSMTPANIPHVKKRILSMDAVAATTRATLIMDQTDSGRITTLLDDFNNFS